MIFKHYKRQTYPQPIYLTIDKDGRADIDYCGQIGSSMRSDRGEIEFKLPVTACLKEEAEAFLKANDALIKKLADSYEESFDGNNFVDKWDEDLYEQMDEICESFESKAEIYYASQYVNCDEVKEIKKTISEENLPSIYEKIEDDFETWNQQEGGNYCLYGLYDFLEDILDEKKEEQDEE